MTAKRIAAALLEEFARARPLPIIGDGMMPTLRPYRDVAMINPADCYCGEGIYALDSLGVPDLYRVQSTFSGRRTLLLMRDNKAYQDREVTAAEFSEAVLGKLIGRIEFFDRAAYQEFVETRCGGPRP
jgi:hypothetical protein